jgi:hypothetical protein
VDDGFVWPAGVMVAGVGVWIALVFWRAFVSRRRESPSWIEPGLGLTAGGLILVSGFA